MDLGDNTFNNICFFTVFMILSYSKEPSTTCYNQIQNKCVHESNLTGTMSEHVALKNIMLLILVKHSVAREQKQKKYDVKQLNMF